MLALTACFAGEPAQGNDAQGDPLPDGAIMRLGSVRWRHGTPIVYASFLADNKTVLTATADGAIRYWEYPSGKLLQRLQTNLVYRGNGRSCLSMTEDRKYLAVMSTTSTDIYDAAKGEIVTRLGVGMAKNVNQIIAMAISGDGKLLAEVDFEASVRVWDCVKGAEIRKIAAGIPNDRINYRGGMLAVSADGKILAVCQNELANNRMITAVKLYEPATGKELGSLRVDNAEVVSLEFSPDGKKLVFHDPFSNHTVAIDVGQATQTFISKDLAKPETCLGFGREPDKLLAYSRVDGSLGQWDLTTGKRLRAMERPASRPALTPIAKPEPMLSASVDGKTVVVIDGATVPHFFDLAGSKYLPVVEGKSDIMLGAAFTADGKQIVTRYNDGTAQLWDSMTGNATQSIALATPTARVLAIDSQGRYAFTSERTPKSLRIVLNDLRTSAKLGALTKSKTSTPAIAIASRGNTALLRWPNEPARAFEAYELPELRLLCSFGSSSPSVSTTGAAKGTIRKIASSPAMSITPDGSLVAAYADAETLVVYEVASGRKIFQSAIRRSEFAGETPGAEVVVSFILSEDGRSLVLQFVGGGWCIIELASGGMRRYHGKSARPVGTDRDWGFRNSAALLGTTTASSQPGMGWGERLALSRSGNLLARVGAGDEIQVFDVGGSAKLATLGGHLGAVRDIAFSPDGKTLVSASDDSTALAWDLSKLKPGVTARKGMGPGEAWRVLAGTDALAAFDAICQLADTPTEAMNLLELRLKEEPPADKDEIEKWIKELDHDQFRVRDKATAELHKLGRQAEAAIEQALGASPSMEAQKRLNEIKARLSESALTNDELRIVRSVEILERIGSTQARAILERLAGGAASGVTAQAAKRALGRLSK
jgi:WD40 repeat protein